MAAALFGAPRAMAQTPATCSASQLHLDISQTPSVVRMGDTINYSVYADNVGPDACDVHNVTVTLQLPDHTGAPVATGTPIFSLANFAAQYPQVPSGVPRLFLGSFPYTVAVDAGVSVLSARTAVDNAQLQDAAHSPVNINKAISAVLFTPSITIDKVGSMTGPAPAPQTVTYTFYVRNGSNPNLDPNATALSNVTVTDDKCGNPTYVSGDTNHDSKLETTETWAFQCTLTHPSPGTYTNTATASGQNILNNRPVPVVSPPDNWTVVLTAPPAPQPPPQGGVLPVTQTQCTLSTARGLRVRARQLNTIRVTVRTDQPLAGKTVHIRLPGASKTLSRKTNARGVATFRVRPARSGRATITAGECATARVSVKPARRVVAPALPQVTG